MTAPLAWLYAIPVERFMSAVGATQVNLILLGMVSVWRVALMVRTISILTGCGWIQVLFRVMFFGNVVALVVTFVMPVPVISVMGGVPYSRQEALILSAANTIMVLGLMTLPIWLVGLLLFRRVQESWMNSWNGFVESSSPHKGMWGVVGCALMIWIPILPFTQAEQRLRHTVEEFYRAGNQSEALSLMAKYKREDFPPAWDPPPRPAYRDPIRDVLRATEFVLDEQVPDWMRELYVAKFRVAFAKPSHWTIGSFKGDELDRFLTLLDRLPDTEDLRKANQHMIEGMQEALKDGEEEEIGN
jgi:hypothetical protein